MWLDKSKTQELFTNKWSYLNAFYLRAKYLLASEQNCDETNVIHS